MADAPWDPHSEVDQHYPHGGAAGQMMDWIAEAHPGGPVPGPAGGLVKVIGAAKGVDFSVDGDTPISVVFPKYVVLAAMSHNNVGGTNLHVGTMRNAPGGGGTDLQIHLCNLDGQEFFCWSTASYLPVLVQDKLYYNISNAVEGPATGDMYLLGYDLSGEA